MRRRRGVMGRVDAPALVSSAVGAVVVRGWAFDARAGRPLPARVRCGKAVVPAFAFARPDVAAAFPAYDLPPDCGFWCEVAAPLRGGWLTIEALVEGRWSPIGRRYVQTSRRREAGALVTASNFQREVLHLAEAERGEILRHLKLLQPRPTFCLVVCARAGDAVSEASTRNRLKDAPWVLPPDEVLGFDEFRSHGTTREYAVLVDEGDTPTLDAFYRLAAALAADPDCRLLYGDDWVADPGGALLVRAKPGWSPNTFRSVDYIGSGVCVRAALARGLAFGGREELIRRLVGKGARPRHLRAFLLEARLRPLALREAAHPSPIARPEVGGRVRTVVAVSLRTKGADESRRAQLEGQEGVSVRHIACRPPTGAPGAPPPWTCLNTAAEEVDDEALLLFLGEGRFVEPDAIAHLAALFDDPDLGAAGPRQLAGGRVRHGQAFVRGRWRPVLEPLGNEPSADVLAVIRDVAGLSFDGLMIPARLFRAVGGLQEAECADAAAAALCWTVRSKGYGVVSTPHRAILVDPGTPQGQPGWPGRPSHRERGLIVDPYYNAAVLSGDPADFTTTFEGPLV